MSFYPSRACKVCKAIKQDEGLLERIYSTKAYIEGSPLSLKQVWLECGGGTPEQLFNYPALTVHVKKHQFMGDTQRERASLEVLVNKAQANAVKQTLEVNHGLVRKRVMEKGMELLEDGNMKISAKDMLSAAAKESDIEEKSKDRNLLMQEMIFAYASGQIGATGIPNGLSGGDSQSQISG